MQTTKNITNAIKIELFILSLSMTILFSIPLLTDAFSIWNTMISVGALLGCVLIGLVLRRSSKILSQNVSLAMICSWLSLGLFFLHAQLQSLQLIGSLDLFDTVLLLLGIELILAGTIILIFLLISALKNKRTK